MKVDETRWSLMRRVKFISAREYLDFMDDRYPGTFRDKMTLSASGASMRYAVQMHLRHMYDMNQKEAFDLIDRWVKSKGDKVRPA